VPTLAGAGVQGGAGGGRDLCCDIRPLLVMRVPQIGNIQDKAGPRGISEQREY